MKKPIKFSKYFKYLLILALPFILSEGFSQSRKELERLRSKKEKEIAITKKKLEETKKKKEKSEEVLYALRNQITQKRELAGIYHTELEKIDIEITHLNEDVQALDFEIDKLRREFAKLVVQGYKKRDAASKINFCFRLIPFPKRFEDLFT
jgi:chromosome segregation ATPase